MDVTIVIPTKNAGALFGNVLDSIFSQVTTYSYEVVCVDSGSKDKTLDIIAKYPCKLYKIKASEFGHGKTRNYGASKGTGEFIVFITQDALPATDTWLQNFIDAMKLDDEIAGGFGVHYAYPDCNIFDKRDLPNHFRNFGEDNTLFHLDDDKRELFKTDEGYRQYLCFFSDNNACLRRRIWEKYPYEDVNFAEDQIWMRQMIEKGYKKVYCPFAPVYHSHNFELSTYYKRYFDEFKGLNEVYGFIISNARWKLPLYVLRQTKHDLAYIRSLPMARKEKWYWLRYSLGRNYCRYFGGYKGGKYASYSPKKQQKLDKKISQQYMQRNA
jgi:rhamnosyltransferase